MGLLFVVSGSEKLIGPYQNFLYVVQGYDLFPSSIEEVVAKVVPWIEFIIGLFLFLGLWTKASLIVTSLLFASFIGIVSQAILRKLDLSDCGCFGELISIPLPILMVMDTVLLILTIWAIKNVSKTEALGLDRYFRDG